MTNRGQRKPGVSDRVMAEMRQKILEGSWPPGSKIPSENELTAMLSVSRVSVRAAIQKLSSLGLLESRQGEGTFVCDGGEARWSALIPAILLSGPDLLELLEFRIMLECECASLAASKITPEQLELMEQNLTAMTAPDISPEEMSKVDVEFHLLIAKATGNRVVYQVYSVMKDVFIESLCKMSAITGTASGIYYHKKLHEAFKSGDPVAADRLMREHLAAVHYSLEEGRPINEDEL